MANKIRVLVWDENPGHAPKAIYPENIRGAVAEGLRALGGDGIVVKTANLDDPNQGITAEALADTDVLLWWAHVRHSQVSDETVAIVKKAVRENGMGFIALHSAHYSKTFGAILEAPGHLKGGWRENEPPEVEEITVCAPKHPIAAGVDDFVLDGEEMYGAPFAVPPPSVVVLQSYFPFGGEYFPSGACWTVGKGIDPDFTSGPGKGVGQGEGIGRVFYFRPGHESVPTFFNQNVRKILYNAVKWCAKK
ncbi:MAG TPA: ThuA domain-containing protein [Armatimonadota bacterium]|jgi:trehalose utilization protein